MMQKNNHPTLSIVTPSYNQERFIDETIKSVISQKGDFNIDYIVIDGKSTDGSIDIIKKYDTLLTQGEWSVKCRGINYRWVSESDKGQADAIAKGFRMAEGNIFAYLNSDDIYQPGALGHVAAFFGLHPDVGMVYGDVNYMDEYGSTMGEYPTEPFDYKRLAVCNFIGQPSAFFTKDAYEEVGGMDVNLQYVMDHDLWIKLAQKVRIEYLPELLSSFRIHKEAKSVSRQQAFLNFQESLQTIFRHYKWAPINRIYGYSYSLVKRTLPRPVASIGPVAVCAALLVSIIKYIGLNKRIRMDDLKAINVRNFGKLLKGWPGY